MVNFTLRKERYNDKRRQSGIFIHTNDNYKANIGNTLETVKVEVDKNIFSRLFTSFSIEPNLVERNGFGVHYTWIKIDFNQWRVSLLLQRLIISFLLR
jgi:hypothetical protein